MPQNPHEYVVRTKENDALYRLLFEATFKGVHEEFKGRMYQCLYPGDGFKYWRMTDDINESVVINRKRADAY